MNVGPSRPGASASQSLDQVLGQSGPMSLLLGALQTSARYWACAQEALPPALRAHVRCGPVLDQRWSLFVPNGAVASKLKHCLPLLQAALRQAGWPETEIVVKVLQPDSFSALTPPPARPSV